LLLYVFVAWAVGVHRDGHASLKYLDPVTLTAGSGGKGSLTKLQIFFFSFVVYGLLTYILMRTGLLSDLSPTILILLGIAGVGATASKAADLQKTRLNFENWAWLVRKKWLPKNGLAGKNDPQWKDLVTTDGEFDVYRFQMLIFSLVVGGALLKTGLTDLASFKIPETLLGVLGLSQVVYVGGKLAGPKSFSDLDDAISAARALETKFIEKAVATPDPAPPQGIDPVDPPKNIAAAKRRAGGDLYSAYLDKIKAVRIMFESVTDVAVDDTKIEPLLPAV